MLVRFRSRASGNITMFGDVAVKLLKLMGRSGNGLGLMTTNKMVQEHGGKMFMHSIPGKGTTFRIILPRMRLPRVHAD